MCSFYPAGSSCEGSTLKSNWKETGILMDAAKRVLSSSPLACNWETN